MVDKLGLKVIPETLEVGDYVLSPEVVIERKSFSDLIGSLKSGRLYTQCVHMARSYEVPVVMVELDWKDDVLVQKYNAPENSDKDAPENHRKSQKDSENTQDSGIVSKRAKISQQEHAKKQMSGSNTVFTMSESLFLKRLLTVMKLFPKVRFAWTSSGQQSAKLFKHMKTIYPDSPQSEEKTVYKNEHGLGRSASFDFLTKLPGIGSLENAKKIIGRVANLEGLVGIRKTELRKLVGNDLLWEFLHPNG